MWHVMQSKQLFSLLSPAERNLTANNLHALGQGLGEQPGQRSSELGSVDFT